MDLRILEFKTEYHIGKPDVDWVHFTSRDAMTENGAITHSTWEKISRVTPTESISNDDTGLKMAAMRSQWAQIEPAYQAWKQGQVLPESGTPLGAWPAVNPQQADALKSVGLHTVEAIAAANEGVLSKPPLPNMREIKRQAVAWLDGRSAAEQAATIARQQEQIDAMMEMLAEKTEEKRGPGRPKKAEAEADAA
jgi:hypothetical protein